MSQADAFVCTSNQDCNAKLQEYLRWGNRFSLLMESRANACIIIFGLLNDKMLFCSPKTR